jgi:hypothetical protein
LKGNGTSMGKIVRQEIKVDDLYINPDNYRYIESLESEIDAIIAMFNNIPGKKENRIKEIINLAKDIAKDGLNPFEFSIVWFNEEIKKYIVIDGNRRITCVKLMSQYKDNNIISQDVPSVEEIYNIKPDIEIPEKIECLVYEELDEAQKVLSKIHQDANNGIGRKPWDAQAKKRANAREGNKSKTFSVIEFVKNNPHISEELLNKMNTNRWSSKLERVIQFSAFKTTYNISFNENNDLEYLDTSEQVFKMLTRLITDIVDNAATNNFRLKDDFNEYINRLPDEYKSQVGKGDVDKQDISETEDLGDNSNLEDDEASNSVAESENGSSESPSEDNKDDINEDEGTGSSTAEEPIEPKKITNHSKNTKVALRLSREYTDKEYSCFGEKGKQILAELESLNYNDYPQAAAGLCRSIMEYTAKLWMDEFSMEFNGNQLPAFYGKCVNMLRDKKILEDKQHKALLISINKENFIDLLNGWIHSDNLMCVQPVTLQNGWKANRLLIELYIKRHSSK